MKNGRYKLYMDGFLIGDSNSVTRLKAQADDEFENLPYTYFAKIMIGNRIYSSKIADGKWQNFGYSK